MMKEVYTIREFAATMGVPWQTVVSWKRKGQIPAKAITPEGTFVKTIIDPYIDAFKNNHAADSSRETAEESAPAKKRSKKMPKKKTKGYPLKVRKEAIRLLTEENLTVGQVAKQIGCSVECVRQWKLRYSESTPDTSTSTKPSPRRPAVVAQESSTDFDEFARQYWQGGSRAVDVLLLPSEIGPKIIHYVNEALRYAYETLGDR